MSQQETHGFQTEVKQLLHLMIHSLYSNKEIAYYLIEKSATNKKSDVLCLFGR